MAILRRPELRPMVGDVDDHRPRSRWAALFDPPREDAPFVSQITAIEERIAPGDRIPLHTHTIEEAILYRDGVAEVTVGGAVEQVSGGDVAFIPAGVVHGTRNVGDNDVHLFAMYPARVLDITYVERNPAPGTEDDEPQPPFSFDLRDPDPLWG